MPLVTMRYFLQTHGIDTPTKEEQDSFFLKTEKWIEKQWSLTFLAPGLGFMQDNFFHGGE